MTKEMREQMESLRSIAPLLNGASENAAKVIEAVSDFLRGLELGITARGEMFAYKAYVETRGMDDSNDMRRQVESCLTFDRNPYDGEWSIHAIRQTSAPEYNETTCGMEFETIDTEHVRWNSLSRGERLRSYDTLPVLLNNLFKAASAQIESAERTSKKMDETLEALGLTPVSKAPTSINSGSASAVLEFSRAVEVIEPAKPIQRTIKSDRAGKPKS